MDVTPVNQGSILAAGRDLIPDYAAQMMQQRLLGIRQQEADTQAQHVGLAATEQQREMAEEAALQQALGGIGENPTAGQMAEIMLRFPRFSEQLRRGWQTLDEGRRNTDFSQLAQIHAAARGGRFDVAAATMRARVQADIAAGEEADPIDTAILEGLESQDPRERRNALIVLETTVSSLGGAEHFASVYGALNPNIIERQGVFLDEQTGEALFQDPRGHIYAGPDGSFLERPPLPGVPTFGGTGEVPAAVAPAGGGATAAPGPAAETPPAAPMGAFDRPSAMALGNRYGRVTSTVRTPEHNREVGGVPNSFHLERNGGRAIDIARRRGVSHAQVVAGYQRDGYTLHPDTRDEGDHSHIVIASGPGGDGSPPRVHSRQQYDRLPAGARYIAPDGSVRTKS